MRLLSKLSLRAVLLAVFAALTFVLLAPGCGRSSLELETPPDASVPPSTCGPSNCPGGCCDASGICRVGSDTRACGAGGQRCSDCIANGFQQCDVPNGKVCGRISNNCGPGDCPGGCCSFKGGVAVCLAGTDPSACGRSGSSCLDCAEQGRSCDPVQRTCGTGQCDPSNCNGCCVGDKCLTGEDNQACGANGQACESCTIMGQSCNPDPGGGGRCEGTPTCGPQNCGGCCDGTKCVAGSDGTACGKQGQACTNCNATGKQCVPQGQPNERTCQTPVTCSAANCTGCCVGNSCVTATTPAACGKGGQVCKGCAANEACTNGVCTPEAACGPANCAGCCVGDICAVGSQNTACGLAGSQCLNCTGLGQVCQGGACQQPACGPANCAGCCSGNTCVVGTQNNACGQGGAQCDACAPGTDVCQAQQCRPKCSPANCAGCCTPANACALGFTNGACGSGGATCTNCSQAGSTCATLGIPRVCANQQTTCPAPYPSCAAATTTPITPALQNLCDDVGDLDAVRAACVGGPTTASCVAAFQVLSATNPACSACLSPFNQPFAQLRGIYRCVAPSVSAACNHSTGCAVECQDTSCTQCPGASEAQCRNQVNNNNGQCNTYVQKTTCVAPEVGPGDLCSPATYGGNYGAWLRGVGDHFCGNGP